MVDALVLLGEASRLPDKPFLDFRGKPLFRHGWDVLAKVFDNVLVSCVPSVERRLKAFNIPYVVDCEESGPISGIRAGFKALSSEYVFVVGCDMPFINKNVISFMQKFVRLDGLVPRHENGFLEPLHAFYHRSKTIGIMDENVSVLEKMLDLLEKLDLVYFDTELLRETDPNFKSFTNINTSDDLLKI